MSESASNAAHSHEPTPPEEPKSPMWLPALGAALFLMVGLWWAITPKAPPPPEEETPVAAAAPAPSAAAANPHPQPTHGGTPRAAGSAPGGAPDNAALQRLLERLPKK